NELHDLAAGGSIRRIDLDSQAVIVIVQSQSASTHPPEQKVRIVIEQRANILSSFHRASERTATELLTEHVENRGLRFVDRCIANNGRKRAVFARLDRKAALHRALLTSRHQRSPLLPRPRTPVRPAEMALQLPC